MTEAVVQSQERNYLFSDPNILLKDIESDQGISVMTTCRNAPRTHLFFTQNPKKKEQLRYEIGQHLATRIGSNLSKQYGLSLQREEQPWIDGITDILTHTFVEHQNLNLLSESDSVVYQQYQNLMNGLEAAIAQRVRQQTMEQEIEGTQNSEEYPETYAQERNRLYTWLTATSMAISGGASGFGVFKAIPSYFPVENMLTRGGLSAAAGLAVASSAYTLKDYWRQGACNHTEQWGGERLHHPIENLVGTIRGAFRESFQRKPLRSAALLSAVAFSIYSTWGGGLYAVANDDAQQGQINNTVATMNQGIDQVRQAVDGAKVRMIASAEGKAKALLRKEAGGEGANAASGKGPAYFAKLGVLEMGLPGDPTATEYFSDPKRTKNQYAQTMYGYAQDSQYSQERWAGLSYPEEIRTIVGDYTPRIDTVVQRIQRMTDNLDGRNDVSITNPQIAEIGQLIPKIDRIVGEMCQSVNDHTAGYDAAEGAMSHINRTSTEAENKKRKEQGKPPITPPESAWTEETAIPCPTIPSIQADQVTGSVGAIDVEKLMDYI